MKFPKLLFFLPLLSVAITSCSSDDSNADPVVVEPPVIDLKNQKLVSFSYPSHPYIGIVRDKESYEYDNENKIVKVKEGGFVYGITYVNSDLIEVNQLEDNITGVKINSKRSIHLKAGSVESIVNHQSNVNESNPEVVNTSSDSTLYTYKNQYISKVKIYSKNTFSPSYALVSEVNFEEQNGNITKAEVNLVRAKFSYTINYTYDADAYVKGSDYTYETPLLYSYNTLYSILQDKFGKKSTNNIVKIDHEYTNLAPYPRSFKTMTLKRTLDTEKRLKEIIVSGTTFDDLKNYVGLDFKDAKATFTYN